MFSLLVGALAFSAPLSRRDATVLGMSAAFAPLLPAQAEYYGQPPPKAKGAEYKEALQAAKEYKYAARPVAGTESDAFKAAEAKRKAAASGEAVNKGSVQDDLARLGLKAYGS